MKKDPLKVAEEMQKVVEQMRLDDLQEAPELANELFECDCCAQTKPLAGSIQYGNYRLCNDCVLLAEVGFELGKIKDIEELMVQMEDKRLEVLCEYIKQDEQRAKN
ncbi:hypothetical protein IJ732_03265 [bacterium]|nr:hypothetical protein [bacterium]